VADTEAGGGGGGGAGVLDDVVGRGAVVVVGATELVVGWATGAAVEVSGAASELSAEPPVVVVEQPDSTPTVTRSSGNRVRRTTLFRPRERPESAPHPHDADRPVDIAAPPETR
jgi:hypothetical protein